MATTASAFDTLAPALHGGRADCATRADLKARITAAEKRMLRAGVVLAGIIVALVKPLPQAAP